MRTIRLALAAVLVAAAIAITPATAHACSCAPPEPPKKAAETFGVVFAGTVTEIDDPQAGALMVSSGGLVHYTFEVDAVAKGDVERNTVVSSARDGVSCGKRFKEGTRYLVFAYYGDEPRRTDDPDDRLLTNICTPTQKLGPDEALPVAAEPVGQEDIVGPPLKPPENGAFPVFPVAITAVIVVLAAALLVARVRSRAR